MKRFAVRFTLFAVLALTLTACGTWGEVTDCLLELVSPTAIIAPPECVGDAFSIIPETAPLAGHYTLNTIGGSALPVQVAGLPSNYAYYEGSIELRSDGSFVDVIRINFTVDSVFGTYSESSGTVSMTPQGWTPYTLHWDPHGAVAATWAEGEYVYKRD